MVMKRPPNGVSAYTTSTGGFSPNTVRRAIPKRIIYRSRSFMTFADEPGQDRRSMLGRVRPSARSPRRSTDHLHPMMLSTMAATGIALPSSFT